VAACLVLLTAGAAWGQAPDVASPAAATGATGAADDGAAALDPAAVAEIVREVEIGAALAEEAPASQPARRKSPAAPAPAASKPGRAASAPAFDDSPYSLRGRSRAAWEWVKETLPWLDKKVEPVGPQEGVVYDPLGVSGSPFDTTLGAAGIGGAGFGAGRGSAGPGAYGSAPPTPGADSSSERVIEMIRDAVAMVREAVTHPMTWLVVSLFVIGGVAIRKFDRRPK
jgi:hypothetical protein